MSWTLRLFFTILCSCLCADRTVAIDTSTFQLQLFDHDFTLLKSYPIGIGLNGVGKRAEGDCKTPIGVYTIVWKASVFYKEDGGRPIADGIGYYASPNSYLFSHKEGAIPLWSDRYGMDEAVFMCLNYPNVEDQSRGYTGDGIAIHATQLGGVGMRASAGCIRMNPSDARDLYRQIECGCKVTIGRR